MSMERVLITGTSSGIGLETAKLFLKNGYEVVGIDIREATLHLKNYTHVVSDVGVAFDLPDLGEFDYVVNNAGTIEEEKAIQTNLVGYINVVEKYVTARTISVTNIASISGHVGLDTPKYAASQGGRLAYTKNLAITLGHKWKTRVNSISPGAVLSGLEPNLYKDEELLKAVANENLLNKWAVPIEIAQWIFFVAVVNKSMTGQDVLIDNGEVANYNFIKAKR